MTDSDTLVVLSTMPSSKVARSIGEALVEQRIVACINILPGMESIYRWQKKICKEQEVLAIMKTTQARWKELQQTLQRLHPYDVPEIIALPACQISVAYAHWLTQQVTPSNQ